MVVTVPDTVFPSFRLTCSFCEEVISCTADQSTVTSPANSVFMIRDLASDFSMVPVRRSPFFSTI